MRQILFFSVFYEVGMEEDFGLINDMCAESRNVDYRYAEFSTQEDFDCFD